MKFCEALQNGIAILEAHGIADAKLDAWYLLAFVTGLTKDRYFLCQQEQMAEADYEKYQDALVTRGKHVPLQHITGEQEFMGMTFSVNEHVLVPRQDTETLVEEALSVIKPGSEILDMCTGSGCVLISIVALGEDVTGCGVDISPDALEVAKTNGARLAAGKVSFLESNLFRMVDRTYDCIVSNPPYIRSDVIETLEPEVKEHEPRLALDGAADGLFFYNQIVGIAPVYLNKGGWLLFEIGYDQGVDVSALMIQRGFMDVQIVKDLAGHDRVVKGHL